MVYTQLLSKSTILPDKNVEKNKMCIYVCDVMCWAYGNTYSNNKNEMPLIEFEISSQRCVFFFCWLFNFNICSKQKGFPEAEMWNDALQSKMSLLHCLLVLADVFINRTVCFWYWCCCCYCIYEIRKYSCKIPINSIKINEWMTQYSSVRIEIQNTHGIRKH